MSDELFNRIMDTLGGFLFGIGFGMVVGVYWLWYTKDTELMKRERKQSFIYAIAYMDIWIVNVMEKERKTKSYELDRIR